eukprot:10065675-Ditylum_brightwellii.AAC.1
MEFDAFHEELGNRTAWEDYINNSDTEGKWIKVLSMGKCTLSSKLRTENKDEENAIKNLKNVINMLSVEFQGKNLNLSKGSDSSDSVVATKTNESAQAQKTLEESKHIGKAQRRVTPVKSAEYNTGLVQKGRRQAKKDSSLRSLHIKRHGATVG